MKALVITHLAGSPLLYKISLFDEFLIIFIFRDFYCQFIFCDFYCWAKPTHAIFKFGQIRQYNPLEKLVHYNRLEKLAHFHHQTS